MSSAAWITDWSAVAWEFSFTTLHPTLFINTPMKVMNPDWQKIETVPVNISLPDDILNDIICFEIEEIITGDEQKRNDHGNEAPVLELHAYLGNNPSEKA